MPGRTASRRKGALGRARRPTERDGDLVVAVFAGADLDEDEIVDQIAVDVAGGEVRRRKVGHELHSGSARLTG